jgi:hypothetical protein
VLRKERARRMQIIRTILVYAVLNLLVYPIYMITGIMGLFGHTLSEDAITIQDLLLFYFIALSPSLAMALAIQIWGNKLKMNKKLNIALLLITAIILFQFVVIGPSNFGEVWNLNQ